MVKIARNSEKQKPEPQLNLLKGQPKDSTEKFFDFLHRFSRYGYDLLGLLVISVCLILLLGLLGITKGKLIDPLVHMFRVWFGWGAIIILLGLLFLGFIFLRWRKYPVKIKALGRIIAIELTLFLLLGIISLIFKETFTLVRASGGKGGVVGWGIAEFFQALLGNTFGALLLILITLLVAAKALNLFFHLDQWARRQTGEELLEQPIPEPILEPAKPEAHITIPTRPSTRTETKKETQPALPLEFQKSFAPPKTQPAKPILKPKREQTLPPLELLETEKSYSPDQATINMTAGLIEKTLSDFGIPAKVVGYRVGPTVTQYAVEPGYIERDNSEDRHKIRISQISSLSKDLALALQAERLRIEAPVPGKSYVGIEVPNTKSVIVRLRSILESEPFYRINSPLAIALGRDVSGKPIVSDLAGMPHLLIAGTTNSGKSVCIASLITCLVMNNAPEDLRLVLIDPKMVELTRFNGLPHILGKVETNLDRIIGVLRWATSEMDYRYQLLEKVHARNIDSYNAKMQRANQSKLPKVVIMVDELADLMMSAPDQTEHSLVRLAQKSRAVGLHLVVATQRPSTDVVTGVIKANFPTRIAFTVASSIDSRVILDTGGAETLLGKGDMLFLHPEAGIPVRSQGVMVTDNELRRIIKWWQAAEQDQPDQIDLTEQTETDEQIEEVEQAPWEETIEQESNHNEDDDLLQQAIELLRKDGKASASYLQRQLRVGYPRAARLIEQLEEMGVIGAPQGGGRDREILLDDQEQED